MLIKWNSNWLQIKSSKIEYLILTIVFVKKINW